MQRTKTSWGRQAPPSWQVAEDLSWSLTVALYIREVLKLPATEPFFIPPLVPSVAENIPVTGPELDMVLADEWSAWFTGLLADPRAIPRGGGSGYFSLEDRATGFRGMVQQSFAAASAAASDAHDAYSTYFHAHIKTHGLALTHLVSSIEKELGHKAAAFVLNLKILPVEGVWLHRLGPQVVLLSEPARNDPGHLHRLLGPVIRELARPR